MRAAYLAFMTVASLAFIVFQLLPAEAATSCTSSGMWNCAAQLDGAQVVSQR